ncbi:MAG: hypothetical protein R3200_00385 [Xanthomonadales bacterium]|nr:hypothetical protein [Xanthomonadales bacterium]
MMRVVLIALAAAMLAACAGLGRPVSLEERAQARWDAVISGDWERAYAYLSPGARTAMSESAFRELMTNRTINWTGAEVVEIGMCDTAVGSCDVIVNVGYRVSRGVPGLRKPIELTKGVTESWIEVDGAWYFVPDRLR